MKGLKNWSDNSGKGNGGGGGGKQPPQGGGKGGKGDGGKPKHEEPDADDEQLIEAIGESLDAGDGDEQLQRLIADYDPEEGPPEWAVDADKWQQAVDAVKPDEGNHDFDADPWLVVAEFYKRNGGEIDAEASGGDKGGEEEEHGEGGGGGGEEDDAQ